MKSPLVIVALAAGLGLALWAASRRVGPAAPAHPARVEVDGEAGRSGAGLRPVVGAEPADRRAASSKAPTSDSTEIAVLTGTVTLIRGDGSIDERPSGVVAVQMIETKGFRTYFPVVAGGQFELLVPTGWIAPAELRFVDAKLEDSAVRAVGTEARRFPDDGRVRLVYRAPVAATLVVRDRATGLQVESVDVVRSVGSAHHPGRADGLIEPVTLGRPSPVEVTPAVADEILPGRAANWFVGGAGYAWQPVVLDPFAGGERLVELAPGGSIRVELHGLGRTDELHLRIAAGDPATRIVDEVVGLDAVIPFSGVPAGEVVASLELDDLYGNSRVLASARGEVVGAGETPLRLSVAPAELEQREAPRFELQVEIEVPAPWSGDELPGCFALDGGDRARPIGLELRPTAVVESGPGRSWLHYDLGAQPAGLWRANLRDLRWAQTFDVTGAGTTTLRVPEPARVEVEVTDDLGAALPHTPVLYWLGPALGRAFTETDGSHAFAPAAALQHTDEPSVLRFTAPAGQIAIRAVVDGRKIERAYDLAPGEHRLRFTIPPRHGVRVRLRDAASGLDLGPAQWSVSLSPLDFDDAPMLVSAEPGAASVECDVLGTGRYRVQVAGAEGYDAPRPRAVVVARGEFVDLIVELARAEGGR
ncbi:hypothetical protein [Engelhardtia mirabilis]|uniref:Uncharacterized protein n=1 Tax=Engelhardtia mirabilis TaxID=2528011 RepID=A0A518BR84_9BACT|nr:hypothetical protein Pla133_46120 [Planctomycetes bacterium Pla133]QDV03818.1 hypothetical protein Pla86_46100 [Planctomycetes bacterium Pla86]